MEHGEELILLVGRQVFDRETAESAHRFETLEHVRIVAARVVADFTRSEILPLTWPFVVRPLGFEPRTCGLRDQKILSGCVRAVL